MLEIKIGRNTTTQNNKEVEGFLTEFVNLKKEEKLLKEKTKAKQVALAEFGKLELKDSDNSSVTLLVGDDAVNIKFDWDIKIADESKLKILLEDRYQDLVNIKTEISPVAKLKQMALNDDGIRECMSVKEKAPAFKVV